MPPRPEGGPLLWASCPDAAAAQAFGALAVRLAETRPDWLLTVTQAQGREIANTLAVPPPSVDPVWWAGHLRPDAMMVFSDPLQPELIAFAERHAIPVLGVALHGPFRRWMTRWPLWRIARATLSRPEALLCEDDATHAALARLGAPAERLVMAGLMVPPVAILPSNEAERESIAELTSKRPVWCATALPAAELAPIVKAHRLAQQHAHRLLLVIVPEVAAEAPAMRERLLREDWTVGLRSEGDDPAEDIEIYIADLEGELGLWLRLAAIAFIGGTLEKEQPSRSPMEAASLGSAILHGAETGARAAEYRRLGAAGAARLAARPVEIAQAVEALIAPDLAAQMAHAAWEVASAGEDALARTIEALDAVLERP